MAPAGDVAPSRTLSEAEAQQWIDKSVYSSDEQNVGSVAVIERDASGRVTALQADVGGFLGIGTSRVKLMPSQFSLTGDRVMVNLTAEGVKQLPKMDG